MYTFHVFRTLPTVTHGRRTKVEVLRLVVLFVGLVLSQPGYSTAQAPLDARPANQHMAHLETLSPSQARELAKRQGTELRLNNLKWLDADTARELSLYSGVLELNGLTELSPAAAQAWATDAPPLLLEYHGISLNGLRQLSIETARHLSSRKGRLSLAGLEVLEPELARTLAQHVGTLELDGLTQLTGQSIAILSRHNGPLSLKGVSSNLEVLEDEKLAAMLATGAIRCELPSVRRLSVRAAETLATNCSWLTLPQLEALSPDLARALAKTKHRLELNGVVMLDAATAKALVTDAQLPDISLNGLAELSPDTAARLAQKNGALELSGLNDLPPEVADQLAKHTGGPLFLGGLNELTPEAASFLARHAAWLYLGVTTLPEATATALAAGQNGRGLTLTRLANPSSSAVAALVANSNLILELSALKPEGITPDVSRALADAKCHTLRLSGLRSLPPDLARDIGFYRCYLELTNVPEIDEQTARLIATNTGVLEFPYLETLSREAANGLSQHRGILVLHDTGTSPTNFERLKKHQGTLIVRAPSHFLRSAIHGGRMNLREDVAEAMVEHKGPLSLPDVDILMMDVAMTLAKRQGSLLRLPNLETVESPDALKQLKTNPMIVIPDDVTASPKMPTSDSSDELDFEVVPP